MNVAKIVRQKKNEEISIFFPIISDWYRYFFLLIEIRKILFCLLSFFGYLEIVLFDSYKTKQDICFSWGKKSTFFHRRKNFCFFFVFCLFVYLIFDQMDIFFTTVFIFLRQNKDGQNKIHH